MMHRPLCLTALLFAAASAKTFTAASAKTSLLQGADTKVKTDRKFAQPLAGLLESAKGLLVNGATPEVTTFVDDTLAELASTIIPAILEESRSDKEWLSKSLEKFSQAMTVVRRANMIISRKNDEEVHASSQHKQCRTDEEVKCEAKQTCEWTLWDLWRKWSKEEVELEEDHSDFHTHFCKDGANGTLNTFRQDSVGLMTAWLDVRVKCEAAREAYDAHLPDCVTANGALDAKSSDCNTKMTTLEDTACDHSQLINSALHAFHDTWSSHHASYQAVTDLVYEQTDDRKKEYRTLKVVECLLRRVREQNGVPCDDTTGGAEDKMHECRLEGEALDICNDDTEVLVEDGTVTALVRDICQEFTAPPATPDQCSTRGPISVSDSGVTEGLECLPNPFLQPSPCGQATWYDAEPTATWKTNEIDPLPVQAWNDPTWNVVPSTSEVNPASELGVSEAGLSESQIGCNAYPPCTPCTDVLIDITPPCTEERLNAGFTPGTDCYHTWQAPLPECTDELRAQQIPCADHNERISSDNEAYSREAQTYARENLLVAPAMGCEDAGGPSLEMIHVDEEKAVRCCYFETQADEDHRHDVHGRDIAEPTQGCKSMTYEQDGADVCWLAATFHDANAICRQEGMRLCTEVELKNECCGMAETTCHMDDRAVWIGYHYTMVDGCERHTNQDHEVRTEVSTEIAATAAVRCCSHDGTTCLTKDLPEFVAAASTTEDRCDSLKGKTYEEAVAICEANTYDGQPMRLCTEGEVYGDDGNGACCGTGCSLDGYHIWVTHLEWPSSDPVTTTPPTHTAIHEAIAADDTTAPSDTADER